MTYINNSIRFRHGHQRCKYNTIINYNASKKINTKTMVKEETKKKEKALSLEDELIQLGLRHDRLTDAVKNLKKGYHLSRTANPNDEEISITGCTDYLWGTSTSAKDSSRYIILLPKYKDVDFATIQSIVYELSKRTLVFHPSKLYSLSKKAGNNVVILDTKDFSAIHELWKVLDIIRKYYWDPKLFNKYYKEYKLLTERGTYRDVLKKEFQLDLYNYNNWMVNLNNALASSLSLLSGSVYNILGNESIIVDSRCYENYTQMATRPGGLFDVVGELSWRATSFAVKDNTPIHDLKKKLREGSFKEFVIFLTKLKINQVKTLEKSIIDYNKPLVSKIVDTLLKK